MSMLDHVLKFAQDYVFSDHVLQAFEGYLVTFEFQQLKKAENEIKFVEDMTPEEKARILKEKTGEALPAGLENLGNTCYMNATVQCLKRVNELKEFLQNYTVPQGIQ